MFFTKNKKIFFLQKTKFQVLFQMTWQTQHRRKEQGLAEAKAPVLSAGRVCSRELVSPGLTCTWHLGHPGDEARIQGQLGGTSSCADKGAAGMSTVLGVVVPNSDAQGGRTRNVRVQGWQFWTSYDLFLINRNVCLFFQIPYYPQFLSICKL